MNEQTDRERKLVELAMKLDESPDDLLPEQDSLSAQEQDDLGRIRKVLAFIHGAKKDPLLDDDETGSDPAGQAETLVVSAKTLAVAKDQDVAPQVPMRRGESQLGRFELIKVLGEGGFATVWLAHDPSLNRQVAIKVLKSPRFSSNDVKQRFEREAKAAAVLSHPNIVPVFESGVIDQERYIASGYCDGITLEHWYKAKKQDVSPRTAAEMVGQLADAVEHAHQRGVVHRDLKPANILIEQGGSSDSVEIASRLKITDFGLAKQTQTTDQHETMEGAILGTPAYMSPEQAQGKPDVGPSSDIYSLGVILYELLTGRVPHLGESHIDTILAIRETDVRPPRRLNPSIAKDLEAICLHCLHRNPRQRYATAHELSRDLHRWLDGEVVAARRVTRLERLGKWCTRNPALTAAFAVVLLALFVASWQWAESARSFRHAVEQTNLATREFERAEQYLDSMTTIVDGFLDELATLGEPSLISKPQRDRLNQILQLQRSLIVEQKQDQRIRGNTLRAYRRISKIQMLLGERDAARATLDEARDQISIPTQGAEAEYLSVALSLQIQYINMLAAQRKMLESQQEVSWMGSVLDDFESILPDSDRLYYRCVHANYEGLMRRGSRETLVEAIEWHEQAAMYGRQLIDSFELDVDQAEAASQNLINLANIQSSLGQTATASANFRNAVNILVPVLKDRPNAYSLRRTLAMTYLNWCSTLLRLKQWDDAEEKGRWAVSGFQDLIDEIPNNQRDILPLAAALSNHSDALQQLGQIEDALRVNQLALDLKEEGLEQSFTGKRVFVSILLSRSRTQSEFNDPQAARDTAAKAIDAWNRYFGESERDYRTEQLQFDIWKRFVETAQALPSPKQLLTSIDAFYKEFGTHQETLTRNDARVPMEWFAEIKTMESLALAKLDRLTEAIAVANEIADIEVTVEQKPRRLFVKAAETIAAILDQILDSGTRQGDVIDTAQMFAIDHLEAAISEYGLEESNLHWTDEKWNCLRGLDRFEELISQ